MMSAKPVIYFAISKSLFTELQLGKYLSWLEANAQVESWQGEGNPTLEAISEVLERAQVLVTGWGTPSLINLLQNWSPETSPLRMVAHTAGTIKYMLPKSALDRGLLVTHSNESLAEAVAEFTIGAMIAMRRQMIPSAEHYRAGKPTLSYTTMHELRGNTVGIIGASAIGKRVMEFLRFWGVNTLLADPYCPPSTAAAYGATLVDLMKLMRESDIISLHAPITPETIHMLRAEHFAAMQDGALFINTARGVLIDSNALLKELQCGRISAMLDVTDPTEPLPADSPFFTLENCVLIPHQAGNSVEARLRQGRYAAEDLLRYLHGEPLKFRVPSQSWDSMA